MSDLRPMMHFRVSHKKGSYNPCQNRKSNYITKIIHIVQLDYDEIVIHLILPEKIVIAKYTGM